MWMSRPVAAGSVGGPTRLGSWPSGTVACLLSIGRDVLRQDQNRTNRLFKDARWRSALWLDSLFLVVFSGRLLVIRENPVTVPYWDQWDAEPTSHFIPFGGCRLTWTSMFDQLNEHRIFSLGCWPWHTWWSTDGQWDPRLEQVVNASIHALTAALVGAAFWLAGGRRRPELVFIVCALTFAPPFSWPNTLNGIQSAVYFPLLFLILELWLTSRHAVNSGPWWLGWMCAACGLFTIAIGI
jgi:hypothetical protein